MTELEIKLQELLKSLFSLKEQQDFFVPSVKGSKLSLKAPKTVAPAKIPGGLPPASKKDPAKVAEQLRNPRPQKPQTEVLKIEENGQWSLNKAAGNTTAAVPGRVKKEVAAPAPIKPAPVPSPSSMAGTRDETRPSIKPVPPLTGSQAIPDKTHIPGTVPVKNGQTTSADAATTPNSTHIEGAMGQVRRDHRQQTLNTPINPAEHGWKHLQQTPEQLGLINGLMLHDAAPVNAGRQGAAFARSIHHGDQAVVKNSADHHERQIRGHLKNNFNSARREVLYHDLAHKFFGLGEHVPVTAGFKVGGDDWSAQKKVGDASHIEYTGDGMHGVKIVNPVHEKTLRQLNNSGQLDKLALMDHLAGHHDRHGNNYLLGDKQNSLHLIDNGTAFDYGNLDSHPTPHYRRDIQNLPVRGDHDHDSMQSFHPEAQKWAKSLKPEEAMNIFKAHGHKEDSPAVKGFMQRLKHLQENVDTSDPHQTLKEGKLKTHQNNEEYA